MRQRRLVLFLFTLWFILDGQIWRDSVSRKNAEGNTLFNEEKYSEALENYMEAQDAKRPKPEISYNIANSLYQQKKYAEALKEYDKLTPLAAPDFRQMVYFNRGNSLYYLGKYQAAAESFEKALELNPGDRDAKHNLELALKKIKEESKPSADDSKKNKQSEEKSSSDGKGKAAEDSQKSNQPSKSDRNKNLDKENRPEQKVDQAERKPSEANERKPSMERSEALQLLDAINELEKKEQHKQMHKLQRENVKGRDW